MTDAGVPAVLAGLEPAFRACAGELGVWSAARLFVNAAWAAGGSAAVTALDGDLGDRYPVVDDVARRVVTQQAPLASPAVDAVLERCAGLRHLVVVGVESELLGPLVDRLPDAVNVVALFDATFPIDEARVRASWTPRVRLVDLGSFQQAAGARSAMLTSVYSADAYRAVVSPVWVRAHSPDIRLLFRRLIGVNLVGARMASYPRWLAETPFPSSWRSCSCRAPPNDTCGGRSGRCSWRVTSAAQPPRSVIFRPSCCSARARWVSWVTCGWLCRPPSWACWFFSAPF
jgi:hypothetical protein